jgi:hypothetical protein
VSISLALFPLNVFSIGVGAVGGAGIAACMPNAGWSGCPPPNGEAAIPKEDDGVDVFFWGFVEATLAVLGSIVEFPKGELGPLLIVDGVDVEAPKDGAGTVASNCDFVFFVERVSGPDSGAFFNQSNSSGAL